VRKPASSNYIRIGLIAAAVISVIVLALVTSEDSANKPKPEAVPSTAYKSECGVYRDDKTISLNGREIRAEVAKSAGEFVKGLAGRPCILKDQGMLFTFKRPGRYAFWMKDMKFPIDIIWIDAGKKIVGEEIDVRPDTYPDRFVNKQNNALYVLELKANTARELNLEIGQPVGL